MIKRLLCMIGLVAWVPASFATTPVAKLDLEKAKQTVTQVCAACHTADGNSVIPQNPKLAGQHPEYLYKQLRNFKSWGGKPAERVNPVMLGMTAALEDADMRALAAYFSQQALKPGEAKERKSVELGRKLWRGGDATKGLPACAGCHGPAGAGLPVQFPRLQGQNTAYTEAQLKAFRTGERANDPNKMMQAVASRLSDQEIKAVADYIAGLH